MRKILLIEDDPVTAHVYQCRIRLENYQVEVATDGPTGLSAFVRFRPDVIILDWFLPELDGKGLLQKIRALSDNVPVIVFTNDYLQQTADDAKSLGANLVLVKSQTRPKRLVEAIAEVTRVSGPISGTALQEYEPVSKQKAEEDFPCTAPSAIRDQLQGVQQLIDTTSSSARSAILAELFRNTHKLASNAAASGAGTVGRMSAALEALVKELQDKPKYINASTLRTLLRSFGFLERCVARKKTVIQPAPVVGKILAVDDEMISLQAVVAALRRGGLEADSTDDPQQALQLLERHPYELVISDFDMPGLDGIELCRRFRAFPAHQKTPMLLVTALDAFETRLASASEGIDEVIGKPFLFIELATKVLLLVLEKKTFTTSSGFTSFSRS